MRIITVALALATLSGLAEAQPRKSPPLPERMEELESKLEDIQKNVAQAGAALTGVQELQAQVTALAKELDGLKAALRGYEELRAQSEKLHKKLEDLDLKLTAANLRLSGRGEIAGYDSGFFLQSPDQRFFLRLNGLVQAAYLGRVYQESELYADGDLGESQSAFQLRRARIEAHGHLLLSQLGYGLTFDLGEVDPGPLLEAYGELKLHPMVGLRVGKQKVPLGRQFLIHASMLQFTERTDAVLAFVPGWDLGAQLFGEVLVPGSLQYQIGMFNGAGGGADDNLDFLYVARVVYAPLGELERAEGDLEHGPFRFAVGGAFSYNLIRTDAALRRGITDPQLAAAARDADGDGEVDNVGIYTAAFELSARYRSMALQGELFYRREDPGAVADDRDFFGAYGQLSYLPLPRTLEVAARYAYWEPSRFGADRTLTAPAKNHELAAAVNLLTWDRQVKWQAEFAQRWQRELQSIERTATSDASFSEVRLQLQVAF